MKFLLLGFGIFLGTNLAFATTPNHLLTQEERASAFRILVSAIEEFDGTALSVRQNRPQSWKDTLKEIETELTNAASLPEVAHAFRRIDATYPNLHSHSTLGPYFQGALGQKLKPSVSFAAEWLAPHETRFKISSVSANYPESENRPMVGDELIAINNRAIDDWSREGFIYCKFAIREQCDFLFAWNFFKQNLSWTSDQKLQYTIRRDTKTWTIDVPVENATLEATASNDPDECTNYPNRYEGFMISYGGNRACVYESPKYPGVAILRITSFLYWGVSPDQKIDRLKKEVNALYPWWKEHAKWDHLVIDVIGNTGGEEPTPWYALFLTTPYQEEYTRFRKTRVLEDEQLRKDVMFSEWDPGKEAWFQDTVLKSGLWNELSWGALLPPIPQFWAGDLPTDRFQPLDHPFRGKISLLLNQLCISSCDGFVWQIKDKLADRVSAFGAPQAATKPFRKNSG